MMEWWDSLMKSRVVGKVGMREFFPSEKFVFLYGVGRFKVTNSVVMCGCQHP